MSVIQNVEGSDPTTVAMACLLLKKLYLDDRKSEESLEQLTPEDLAQMKAAFTTLLGPSNLEAEPMSLLRRKAELLCKIYNKLESFAELVALL